MSIRPMDFQVLYPKTTELSKTYTDEANKNHVVNQQQAEANRDRIDQSLKQVVSRENVQQGIVKERQQRDNNSQKEKNKKRQNNKDDRPKFDVRI